MKTVKRLELVNYDGEKQELDMSIDARAMMTFEKIYQLETKDKRGTFIKSLEKLQDVDMTVLICMMAATLKRPDKKQPVGLDYIVDEIPPLVNLEKFMNGLQECLEDLKVEPDKEDMGK